MRRALNSPGLGLSCSLLLCLEVLAADSRTNAVESGVFDLGEIVVAGQPTPEPEMLSDAAGAEDIRRFERRDLGTALNLLPGVTLNRIGPRNEAGVYVRGFDLRQVPVFIDGIPVYVPYDGYVDLGRFTVYDAAEISVAKGFSSVIYGPNALGGAINLVSRRPVKELEVDALAGVFSGEGREFSANIGTRQDRWYVQGGASYLAQDYFELSDDYQPVMATENGGRRENSYREDWRANAKLGWLPNETDEYTVGFAIQEGEKGNPPYAGTDPRQRARFWQWPEWNKTSAYFVSHTQLGEQSYVKPRLYVDWFDNTLKSFDDATYTTQTLPSSFTSIYDDYSYGGSLEFGTTWIPRNTLKAAIHGKFDHHDEHNVGQPHYVYEDQTFAFALEDTFAITDRFSAVAGASYEFRDIVEAVDGNTGQPLDGDRFDAFNPQLGLFYSFAEERHTVFGTVARKSRFPTIKDRYSYRLGQAIPNPNLEPEYALHYEAGYTGSILTNLTAKISGFFSDVQDTIQRVDNVATNASGGSLFQLQNVGASEHYGAEAALEWRAAAWLRTGASYSYVHRENVSQPDVYPIDTPEHKVFGYADITPWTWCHLIPSVEYNSSRYSTSDGIQVDGFALANFKVAVELPRGFTLSAGVNNLFDEDYQLMEGFPEEGRSFFANLRFQF